MNHWIQLISRAKVTEPKFYVKKMESESFLSTENLEKMIVNRRKKVDGEKVNWHKIREIRNEKVDAFSIYIQQAYHKILKKFN